MKEARSEVWIPGDALPEVVRGEHLYVQLRSRRGRLIAPERMSARPPHHGDVRRRNGKLLPEVKRSIAEDGQLLRLSQPESQLPRVVALRMRPREGKVT